MRSKKKQSLWGRTTQSTIRQLLIPTLLLLWLTACGQPDSRGTIGLADSPTSDEAPTATVAIMASSVSSNSAPSQLLPTAQQSVDTSIPSQEDIEVVRKELARTDLDEQTRRSLEAKLEGMIAAQQQAEARIPPVPKDPARAPSPVPVPTSPPRPIPQGIVEVLSPPFHAWEVQPTNAWQGEVDGVAVRVYAGALPPELRQGIVIVVPLEGDQHSSCYPTPTQEGAVRITAEQNRQLTLAAASDATLVFDLRARQFVAPDGTRIAPGPMPTPLP